MTRQELVLVLLLVGLMLLFTGCRTYGEPIAVAAEDFINKLADGRAAEAAEYFNDDMKEQLSPVQLEAAWEVLEEAGGRLVEQRYREVVDFDFHRVILITGIFEKADVEFRITFDEGEKIAGLYIKNPEPVERVATAGYQFSRR
ncbi:MAG TPA: DUF3887 domain-containing protein [Clostridia bacterium]|nr:DUF3887 domain-containing protein [Clostridia bacterium]